jgi:ubiquinone/menaquinone biosynthesis C-methylase UbiE
LSNNYYNDKVEELAPQYLSLSFDDVHHNWAHHLPSILKKQSSTILDFGAGAGRDVSHIAEISALSYSIS